MHTRHCAPYRSAAQRPSWHEHLAGPGSHAPRARVPLGGKRRGEQLKDIFGVRLTRSFTTAVRGMNRSPTSARQRSPDDQRVDPVEVTPVHQRASRRLRGDSPEFSPLHFTPRGTQTTDAATMTSQLIRSVIMEELSKFQAPQTTTALSVADVVRDELRQLMREPEREPQSTRRIPTYSEVLRQPVVHNNAAVAMAAPYPPTARSAPHPPEPTASYQPPALPRSDHRGTSTWPDPARMRHALVCLSVEKEEENS
ncbi:hypothetical protein HPB52_017218 [Rhipicephalus sanguineus]|uniref:Uncharacterized protein n=1 Tax=Rhipicephalus sanguineus TaxID=34632 RepID=A0A9D4PML4_RHISA|nr:hypothetical protein HPB52_017218 [Rhipicephalus sanguineus]